MTELAQLAHGLGVNERTLRRAVSQGALRARRPSPRVLDLPLSERRYIRRSWPLLSALRLALRTERNVRFALLFGSAATGADTPTSDVDVLVDLRDQSLERVADLSAKLEAAIGRPVDIVRLEDAEADPSFLAGVMSEGRVLVDRENLWSDLRRREADLRRRGRRQDVQRTRSALAGIDRLLAAQRVQDFVADLAIAGVRLSQLPRKSLEGDGSPARQAFEALRDAKVIDGELCRRLTRAQKARSLIEHSYVRTPAGDVHRATRLIHETARDFIGPYRSWVGPLLELPD